MSKYELENEDLADGIYNILNAVDWKLGGGYDVSTGIDYRNDVFESFGFWGHCEEDDWDGTCFHHFESGLKVEWYKRVGRSTESNQSVKPIDWNKIVIECLESVRDDGNGTAG